MFDTLAERLIATIISVGSLVFPFIESIEPTFTEARIAVIGNRLCLSTQLENWHTPELDRVISSGQAIRLAFQIEVYRKDDKQPLLQQEFRHTARFNLIDKNYEISFSELEEKRTAPSLEHLHTIFARLEEVKILEAANLKKGVQYYLRVTAKLEKIAFLDKGSDFDLMLFWNSQKPTVISDYFDLNIFLR